MLRTHASQEDIIQLVEGFAHQTLPSSLWTHEAHLTVALWYLKHHTLEEATCLLRSGIIIYNHLSGGENTPQKGYHETLTLFWIYTIHQYLKANQENDILVLCNNFLQSEFAQREYPLFFYDRNILFSTQARAFWIEPQKIKKE